MTITAYIKRDLQVLGIPPCYHGYKQSRLAIELAVEDEDRLLDITKQIYWTVAETCSCDRACIERNIRTVIHIAWKANRSRLNALAGRQLNAPPFASEFISMLSAHIQRTYQPLPKA